MLKRLLSFTKSIFIIFCLQYVVSADAATKQSILFVQTAQSATLSPISGQQDSYLITLQNVKPVIVWFTDRPKRTAGKIPVTNFVTSWNNTKQSSFKNTPPNAALVSMFIESNDTSKVTAPILTLSNPVYDPSKKTMSYQVKLVKGSQLQKKQLNDVALLIDNASEIVYANTYVPFDSSF